jgi:hypothetical protein
MRVQWTDGRRLIIDDIMFDALLTLTCQIDGELNVHHVMYTYVCAAEHNADRDYVVDMFFKQHSQIYFGSKELSIWQVIAQRPPQLLVRLLSNAANDRTLYTVPVDAGAYTVDVLLDALTLAKHTEQMM